MLVLKKEISAMISKIIIFLRTQTRVRLPRISFQSKAQADLAVFVREMAPQSSVVGDRPYFTPVEITPPHSRGKMKLLGECDE
jgi:hypothetical protein